MQARFLAPLVAAAVSVALPLFAQPVLSIALPERTRLLDDQRVDLVVELRNATANAFRVTANGEDITGRFGDPKQVDLDCNGGTDFVFRADLVSFRTIGWVRLVATVETASGTLREIKDITVQPFKLPAQRRSVIYYIGDAMAESYRDAGRIVGRSIETAPGVSGLREGFYDRLLEMDQMPVSGVIMTHGSDKIIPDSANTASALAMGNKTFDGALSVFGDGTDCAWASGANAANLAMALDNPRIETVAEYLKRRFGYRVGLVTTAAATDATAAAEASHMGERDAAFEVARQYIDSPMLDGQPAVDVLMGGGKEAFDPDIRADGRDLVAEFAAKGYRVVTTATELRDISAATPKVLGLFRRATTVSTHSSRIRPSSAGHMNVAYDKLGLTRPGSEPVPDFGTWKDQPFLDLMTRKAIEALSGPDGSQPFFLMVEGASIDKQSHSAHAAGTIWDVIELDKAVGAGRGWARARKANDTLLVVTADHGQTMSIIGVTNISDADLFDRTGNLNMSVASPAGTQTTRIYKDVNTNVRFNLPYGSNSGRMGPPSENWIDIYGQMGFPDYIDADGDGYPENRETGGKGRMRLAVAFRTGSHSGLSLPLTAEGPGAFLFTGYMDQADVPLKIAAALGNDTSDADALLKKVVENPAFPRTPGK